MSREDQKREIVLSPAMAGYLKLVRDCREVPAWLRIGAEQILVRAQVIP